MNHISPDTLSLLALGEHVGSADDRTHLAACGDCRAELDTLQRTAVVARSTMTTEPLLDPPTRVWARISEELALGSAQPQTSAVVTELHRPRDRRGGRPSRRAIVALSAAAAVALVAGGVGAAWIALRPAPVTVLASASLQAFPAWVGSTGEAVVEEEPGGGRVIALTLDTPADLTGYREVWLMNSDASQLVSLGVVDGTSGTFTIPDGLDLSRYDVVDVSSEPYNGNPAHSGDSILRGHIT